MASKAPGFTYAKNDQNKTTNQCFCIQKHNNLISSDIYKDLFVLLFMSNTALNQYVFAYSKTKRLDSNVTPLMKSFCYTSSTFCCTSMFLTTL